MCGRMEKAGRSGQGNNRAALKLDSVHASLMVECGYRVSGDVMRCLVGHSDGSLKVRLLFGWKGGGFVPMKPLSHPSAQRQRCRQRRRTKQEFYENKNSQEKNDTGKGLVFFVFSFRSLISFRGFRSRTHFFRGSPDIRGEISCALGFSTFSSHLALVWLLGSWFLRRGFRFRAAVSSFVSWVWLGKGGVFELEGILG